MSRISIIAAIDKKRGIGKKGKLPWYIPGELKRFKEITMGHPIVMGRKTYESIGRILPGRINIIITRDKSFKVDRTIITHSLDDALSIATSKDKDEVFVIGGGQIFEEALNKTDRLYLTLINKDFEADVFFPDYSDFKKVVFEEEHEMNGLRYKFLTLEK